MIYKNIIEDELIKKILNNYEDGLSIRKISNLLNINRNQCSQIIKESGKILRNKSQSRRVHKMNEDYFSNIDTEEKAYWLGFIAADGGVYANKLAINLGEKDELHLYKFIECINSTSPVRKIIRKNHNRI